MQVNREVREGSPQGIETETPHGPAAVVEAFVRLIEAGRVEPAIRLLSGKIVARVGFEKLESIFSTGSREIWLRGGIESVEVQTLESSGGHVAMQLILWYGDHKVETELVELVRENDQWTISMEEIRVAVDRSR